MNKVICSIYDAKAEAYMQPFFVDAEGVALREFANLANNPDHPIGQHPDDYTLFYMGTWAQDTGLLEGEVPRSIVNGIAVLTGSKVRSVGLTD